MAQKTPQLGLTPEELDALMTTSWNMRVATMGPGERINLTPLRFAWAGGKVYFYCRGQKVANLRRNPSCTILVDRNESYSELQGAMVQGCATVLEDAVGEAADPDLEEARWQYGSKYAGQRVRSELSARGQLWRWVVLEPERVVTWDNQKLPARANDVAEKH